MEVKVGTKNILLARGNIDLAAGLSINLYMRLIEGKDKIEFDSVDELKEYIGRRRKLYTYFISTRFMERLIAIRLMSIHVTDLMADDFDSGVSFSREGDMIHGIVNGRVVDSVSVDDATSSYSLAPFIKEVALKQSYGNHIVDIEGGIIFDKDTNGKWVSVNINTDGSW